MGFKRGWETISLRIATNGHCKCTTKFLTSKKKIGVRGEVRPLILFLFLALILRKFQSEKQKQKENENENEGWWRDDGWDGVNLTSPLTPHP